MIILTLHKIRVILLTWNAEYLSLGVVLVIACSHYIQSFFQYIKTFPSLPKTTFVMQLEDVVLSEKHLHKVKPGSRVCFPI